MQELMLTIFYTDFKNLAFLVTFKMQDLLSIDMIMITMEDLVSGSFLTPFFLYKWELEKKQRIDELESGNLVERQKKLSKKHSDVLLMQR